MSSADNKIAALREQLDRLEEQVLSLEVENHDLQQQVKHYEFDRYKLQEIQRLAKAGTWELNNLTYQVAFSDELTLLLGDKPTKITGMPWHDFLNMIVAEDSTDINKKLIEDVIQNGKTFDFEHDLTRPDGRVIYVHHHCKTFYNAIGQPLITVGMMHDFTFEHDQSSELEKRSMTDELTQLYNRRYINNILKKQYDLFRRYHTVSSYIMVDIDYFKRINDSFGHQVGDEVLQNFASFIKDGIRSIDFASRWGGEEFLIVLSNTPLKSATLLAEKLRKGLMKLQFSTNTVVTASFGVGQISDKEGTNALLKRIDDALYQAKAEGRNRVVTSKLSTR